MLKPFLLSTLLLTTSTSALSHAKTNLTAYTSSHPPQINTNSTQNEANYTAPYFPLLNFTPSPHNPILAPNKGSGWESAYLYNPAAILLDEKIFLLYRAQNESLVSAIGLAWSHDGWNFTRYTKPVVQPSEWYETHGTEDPRVVRVNGTVWMTYTGYDGTTARLCLARSVDLVNWEKYGPILPNVTDVNYRWDLPINAYVPRQQWSKSGAIVAEKINGLYQMQFGDNYLLTANSTDMIHWNYTQNDLPFADKLNVWEQALMESGPPPVKTRDGKWLKIYNGVALGAGGYVTASYNTGQMLIDMENAPRGPPIARIETPLLTPVSQQETQGQVDNVVFVEGLVQFKGYWWLYFGQGDQYLGVATSPVQP